MLFLAAAYICCFNNVSAKSCNVRDSENITGVVIENGVLKKVPKDFSGHFAIGKNVTCIGVQAFYQCAGLTGLTIPNSVTIPGSVTTVEYAAFAGCVGLKSVKISNGVKTIGDIAFGGCIGLTSIEMPNSVTSIGDDVFMRCESLKTICVPKGSKEKFKQLLPETLWNKIIEKQ